MEKDCGSWFYKQHLHSLSPGLNPSAFGASHSTTEFVSKNPHALEASRLGTIPFSPVLGLQQSRTIEPNNTYNCFHGMPCFNQAYVPVYSASKENIHASPFVFGQQRRSPAINTSPPQKRFLVFDQSGEKTTLLYSSGIHNPVQCGTCWAAKPHTSYSPSKQEPWHSIYPLRPLMNEEKLEDDLRDDTDDEMHEDTEELNALLFSDSDNEFLEDDEETSTGHSPSTMTDNGIRELVDETGEEVNSFAEPGPTKRRKLLDDSPSKTYIISDLEDDAESGCGNGSNQGTQELGLGGKRSRREKIRETVNILQSIIPGVDGKDDAIVVIDEAIHYLRSLKVKAKALGLDAL